MSLALQRRIGRRTARKAWERWWLVAGRPLRVEVGTVEMSGSVLRRLGLSLEEFGVTFEETLNREYLDALLAGEERLLFGDLTPHPPVGILGLVL